MSEKYMTIFTKVYCTDTTILTCIRKPGSCRSIMIYHMYFS